MTQPPYSSQPAGPGPQQYGQPPVTPFIGSPALAGARATSAGRQLLVWLLDGVIFGVPLLLLSIPGFLPLISKLIDVASLQAQHRLQHGLSKSQQLEIFGSLAVGVIVFWVLLLIYHFIYWWLIATKGRTPGMSIMGMRLVSLETGQPIGWGQAFLRGLVVVLGSQLTGGIGGLLFWLSPLFDSSSGWAQSWHDKLVKAVIIDTKNGRDTFTSA